jgi:xanthine/uracil permease
MRRFSPVALLGRFVQDPVVPGVIVMILATQLSSTGLPTWLGTPESPGFPLVNLGAGAVAAALVIALTVLAPRGSRLLLRRAAVLIAIIVATIVYAVFAPTSFGEIGNHLGFTVPRVFPFGFSVHADLVLIFFITLLPAIAESVATYGIVARWGGQELPGNRVAQGVFGEVVGSTVGSVFGGLSTLAYPDNVGLLRVTRVGSRYVTLATGIILLVLGGLAPFDALLQAVPLPVLAAAGTVLFGVLFASAIDVLSTVKWTQRNLLVAGVPFIAAIGGLFIAPTTLAAMPVLVRLILGQPLILGTVLLIVLRLALGDRDD